jgi:GT2 family glycosyltransferase
MSGLTVVIPSRTLSNLEPCVAAVRKHEPDCRIVVVWDQSRDNPETVAPCRDYRVVTLFEQFVYARNCNAGIGFAGRDDVVLLNDDALLTTPGGFTAMQYHAAAKSNVSVGIVGATTNITGQPLQRPAGVGLRAVPHFAFVCVFIPRSTIDKVGLLDERYCVDYGVEDRDYCEAVKRSGLLCAVDDGCFVDHSKLVSTFRGDPWAPKSYAQNWALFVKKWGAIA